MGMKVTDCAVTMSTTDSQGEGWPELVRATKTIVVVDVVESVRLMQANEADVIDRWRRFVHEVRSQVLPAHQGRMVKSLGDGMLLEFDEVLSAVKATFELQRRLPLINQGKSASQALLLRIGAHVGAVSIDRYDVYGSGVNLAARFAASAEPGTFVVSAEIRDALVHELDARVEDLGEKYFKHLDAPRQCFALSSSANDAAMPAFEPPPDTRSVILVLPFTTLTPGSHGALFGDLIADEITRALSRCAAWRVISQLSAAALRGRRVDLQGLRTMFDARYVISGKCFMRGSTVLISLELTDVHTGSLMWADSMEIEQAQILSDANPVGNKVAQDVARVLFANAVEQSRGLGLDAVDSHVLLFSAIALMHHSTAQDFQRSHACLEKLLYRHPRSPDVLAWQAKWHVMSLVQAWTTAPDIEVRLAHQRTQSALRLYPSHPLALSIDGLVAALIDKDLERAEQRYTEALAANSSEPLAWLFMSALYAYRDQGAAAVDAARQAIKLSPLDPMRYFFETFSAHAMLSANQLAESVSTAELSLRLNRRHMPTYRTLAIAQLLQGDVDAAKLSVQGLLAIDPRYSVDAFERNYPGRGTAFANRCAQALRQAGLPQR